MKKFPNILQALLNLERESEKRNMLRYNTYFDYPEWIRLIEFKEFHMPMICDAENYLDTYLTTIEIYEYNDIKFNDIYFRVIQLFHTSPFVYLNLQ